MSAAVEPLDAAAVDALGRGLEHVQTHLSHVFLAPARVYKLRKAVDFGFVSFASRAERNADCVREVLLNRRLAPDVYLGVVRVLGRGAGARFGDLEEPKPDAALDPEHEHCVVMRRLPQGRDALALLSRGAFGATHVERVATRMAEFHASHRLGPPPPLDREAWLARIRGPIEANFEALGAAAGIVADALVRETRLAALTALARLEGRLDARRRAGLLVDGHGDLHLQHVFFERDDAPPLLIDCLEFNDDLRRIDAASEVAFLAMDLRYRGRRDLAEHFLATYASASDDFDLYSVVDFFTSYRAAVRAKVAALAAGEPEIDAAQRAKAAESARSHFMLARRALDAPPPGPLVLVSGAVGVGKSTAARVAQETLSGAIVASDRVRKRLAGLEPTDRVRGARQEALYADAMTDRVYAALLERAAPVLTSGRAVVLDATFARRRHRAQALGFAERGGFHPILLEIRCDRETALARLAAREARGTDPSDAGPGRYDASVAAFEPTDEWPMEGRITVDTAAPDWREQLSEALRERISEALRERICRPGDAAP